MFANRQLDAIIDHRFDIVFLFDVTDGNPNGDPDAGNMPRLDPQSLQGYVTDVCLKRKIRNAVAAVKGEVPGYRLYFQTQDAAYQKRVLNWLHEEAYRALEKEGKLKQPATQEPGQDQPPGKDRGGRRKKEDGAGKEGGQARAEATALARAWMCQQFYDVRAFGAVMTLGVNCGQVRGPVQITFARSVDQIVPLEVAITRKSVATEEEAKKQTAKDGSITGTMGRKNLVPYGLYRGYGFINPLLARDTKFTYGDLQLLIDSLRGLMWELDRSAGRGLMATRGLYVFEHDSLLGNAPAHELFDRIAVQPFGADAATLAPRSFADYVPRRKVREDDLPVGVTLHRVVG
jgi:CRISPR-associated protein Csd2